MRVSLPRPLKTGLCHIIVPFLTLLSPAIANAANQAPSISGSPPTTVVVGKTYYFKPTASDSDGDKLTFSIVNKPGWASFSATTGVLTGTPKAGNVGDYPAVTIKVTDGLATRSLNGFNIEVKTGTTTSSNGAPTISGTPQTYVGVGSAYSFLPKAGDPDGDALTFSITNKPGWTFFSTSTGRLYGTPSSSGSYSNVTIKVSDGKITTALAPFTIKVGTAALGNVTLKWTAPTKNTDGSPLTNLSGYRVYYGQQSGQYSQTLSLPNPSLTNVAIEDLPSGTWYFAVRALANNGGESTFSKQVSKLIQ